MSGERLCASCSADISGRHHSALRCKSCAAIIRKKWLKDWHDNRQMSHDYREENKRRAKSWRKKNAAHVRRYDRELRP